MDLTEVIANADWLPFLAVGMAYLALVFVILFPESIEE